MKEMEDGRKMKENERNARSRGKGRKMEEMEEMKGVLNSILGKSWAPHVSPTWPLFAT